MKDAAEWRLTQFKGVNMKYKIESANALKPATPVKAIDYVMTCGRGFYQLNEWGKSAVQAAFASNGMAVSERDFDLVRVHLGMPDCPRPDWFRSNLEKITLIKVKPTGRVMDDQAGHYSVSLTDSEQELASALGRRFKFAVVDLERKVHQILTLNQMWDAMHTAYPARTFVF